MQENEMQEEVTAAPAESPELVEARTKMADQQRTIAELKVIIMQLQAQLNQAQAQLIQVEYQKAQSELHALNALGGAQPANTHLMP